MEVGYMGVKVTDKELLRQLNEPDSNSVTDPALLDQLNAPLTYTESMYNPMLGFEKNRSDFSEGASKILRSLTTGIGAGVISGGKGLYDLATGVSGDQTLKNMHDYQQANTYQAPPGSVGANAIERFNAGYNPLTWPGMIVNNGSQKLQDAGYTKTAAGLEGLMGVSPVLAAGALFKKPTPLAPIAERPPVPRVEGIFSGLMDKLNGGLNGNAPKPNIPPMDRWTELQRNNSTIRSGGAAATPFTEQARAVGAPQDLIDSIAKAEQAGVLNEAAARNQINAASLPKPMTLSAGAATRNGDQFAHEMNMRSAEPKYKTYFANANQGLIDNIDSMYDTSAAGTFHPNTRAAGQFLIDSYQATDKAAKLNINNLYKTLEESNGGLFPIDGVALGNNALKLLTAEDAADFLPKNILKRVNEYASGEKPMSFKQFETFRTQLSNANITAQNASQGSRVNAISLVRNALEDFPLSKDAQHLKPIADAARAAARSRFENIKSDPAYSAVTKNKASPDKFIDRYVIGSESGSLQNMRNILNNPLADQTISASTVDFLRGRAGIRDGSGKFSQHGFNTALNGLKHLPELVSPELELQLKALGDVSRNLIEEPPFAGVNYSNSGTMLAGLMPDAAWAAAHLKSGGITKFIKDTALDGFYKAQSDLRAHKATRPGAGVNLNEYPK